MLPAEILIQAPGSSDTRMVVVRSPRPEPGVHLAWRLLALAAGAGVFLVLNLYLLFESCRSNEFMVTCSGGSGEYTALVLFVLGLVGAASLITSIGRNFAVGFVGALLCLSVVSAGACTSVWSDPYQSGMRRWVRPYLNERSIRRRTAEQRRQWVAAMNARPMDVARGVALAGAAIADQGRTVDSERGARHEIPIARGEDDLGQPIDEVRGDPGWRVTYERGPSSGYLVRVGPDELLDHKWPRIVADASGRFEVQASPDAQPLPITPVSDLREMVDCLKGIPAEAERMRVKRGGLSYGWFLTSMSRKLCPGVAPRLKAPIPNAEDTSLLSIQLPLTGDGARVDVTTYRIQMVIREPSNEPFAFDLLATGAAGFPRYLATFEGAVHTTTEARAATRHDPVVTP